MVSDIAIFFVPVPSELVEHNDEGTVGSRIKTFSEGVGFPDIEKGSVVLFGVAEDRRSSCKTTVEALNSIRKELYQLKDHFGKLNILDLGNINPGESVEDTYYAVSNSVAAIIKQGGIAIVLGGGQDLTYANYLAYEKLEQVVNLVCVDSRFDLGDVNVDMKATQYLQKIILHQPNVLFNFSNLAYQSHHALVTEVELMKKLYFDVYRLGDVQNKIEDVEPIVRNADSVSIDMSCIRSSDFPSNYRSEPNGLYGEETCAIARYAGLSDKVSSIGLYDALSNCEDLQSTKLTAQVLWYFLSGVGNRKQDYPFADKNEYLKYTVSIEKGTYDIIFYKSQRSDRWWMEVPYPSKRGEKYQRHFMVPCSYNDYQRACENEVPDRWWQTFQKLG
ncbi:MAG: formimidoylglutamase [Flavobacteriales bacterium]|nr:formimidoylglutamase [Flavobacteriales bacterium]